MKYAILIYGNPESRRIWASMPSEARTAGLDAYARLNEELQAAGELIVTEALADPVHTRHVTVHEGQALTGDGPFVEAKELLAGFYLVDCDSIERAVEIGARIPEAAAGRLEIRPVMTDTGLE